MAGPRFSIIIPTYRRPDQLARCMDGVSRLDYPRHEFEVVVVSDDPGPAAEEVARRYSAIMPVRVITQNHGGPAWARNTGAAATKGEFLLFLDDDCIPTEAWLQQWELHSALHAGDLAGGGTINAFPKNLCSSASQSLLEFIHEYFNDGRTGHTPFLASNNLCVPAKRFREIGGFSTAFPLAAAEDRDFCDRWCARGWPTSRAEAAQVLHAHHLTLAGFWRQHRNYGRGAFYLRKARLARRQPFRVEPVRFYFNLIRYPWGKNSPARAAALSLLLLLSQIAYVSGYVDQRYRRLAPRVSGRALAV